MSENPIEGLSKKTEIIEIAGNKFKVLPKIEDLSVLGSVGEKPTKEDIKNISNLIVELIHRGNPEIDVKDIEALVTRNYGSIFAKILPLYGFEEINLPKPKSQ